MPSVPTAKGARSDARLDCGAHSRRGHRTDELSCDEVSLHAAVWIEAHDRERLEQLCGCITRSALSDERVQLNAAEQVELKLKTPWRDDTMHLVMSPLKSVSLSRMGRTAPHQLGPLVQVGL